MPSSDLAERGRRLRAGVVGGLLALAAYASSGFAYRIVVRPNDGAVSVTYTCPSGYHCPTALERAIVDKAFAIGAIAVLGMLIYAALALLRYAFAGRPVGRRVWIAAAVGPVLGFSLVVAALLYGGWVGAFS